MNLSVTLGPVLFHWPAAALLEFYRRIADETGIDRVYLGEVVCGKRAPLIEAALVEAADILERGGKEIVWSAPALPNTPRERRGARELIACGGAIELNDMSGLVHLAPGSHFVAGPLLNIYNEVAAAELVRLGCSRLCPNIEMPLGAIAEVHRACPDLELELFAFGRLPLALSGRCYHARQHGLHKDACQFVCDQDPDGLSVRTLEGEAFLALNGVLTMSHGVQVIDTSRADLLSAGVAALRLSPHTVDMIAVAETFGRFARGEISAGELQAEIDVVGAPGPLVSGYLAGAAGMRPALAR